MNLLPVNLDDLIHARGVESERREFKKAWNEFTRDEVVRTVCAFANDLHNLNGGYIVLGIEDDQGRPVLPPSGLDPDEIDGVQREIAGACRRIVPEYAPLLSAEEHMGRAILVVWAPAGDTRPYRAPKRGDKGVAHFVRVGSSTEEARGDLERQLLEIAPRIPLDDRRRHEVPVTEISGALVRKFLSDVHSDLLAPGVERDTEDLARALRLTSRINGREAPRNVALLMFSDNVGRHFPYARIESAHFGDDAGGDLIEEKTFNGPLDQQVRMAIDYVRGLSTEHRMKVPGQAEVERFDSFPYEAVEEALVNAVIHRGYDAPPEPIKVYFYPNRLEITSYPGPVQGFDRKHLDPASHLPPPPARNRRVGEFFKELRLAELRGTGIPKIRRRMKENGSPEPVFYFDDGRTYFSVTLPAHPGYVVLHSIRESAQLWHTGDRARAIAHLEEAFKAMPRSGALAAQLIDFAARTGNLDLAARAVAALELAGGSSDIHLGYTALARAYLDADRTEDAVRLLAKVPAPSGAEESVDLAILHKRSGDYSKAHQIFKSVAVSMQSDPKALHEYAQTKMKLASEIRPRTEADSLAREALNREATQILRRVIALAADQPARAAWAWFDLARTLHHLRESEAEIRKACETAVALMPEEKRFRDWIDRRDRENRGDRRKR